jgi:hypothetical protein
MTSFWRRRVRYLLRGQSEAIVNVRTAHHRFPGTVAGPVVFFHECLGHSAQTSIYLDSAADFSSVQPFSIRTRLVLHWKIISSSFAAVIYASFDFERPSPRQHVVGMFLSGVCFRLSTSIHRPGLCKTHRITFAAEEDALVPIPRYQRWFVDLGPSPCSRNPWMTPSGCRMDCIYGKYSAELCSASAYVWKSIDAA